jgi:threonine/homoserine/homoserine lactone efflux protein
MIEVILAGIPLGIFLSLFMVGPVYFILLETSALKGFKAAFIFDLGAVFADIVFITIAYLSSYRLIQSLKDEPSIFIFGGILMLTYGIISFLKINKVSKSFDEADIVEITKNNYFGLFVKGFLLNFINIGVLLFWFFILVTVSSKLHLQVSKIIVFFTSVLATYLIFDIGKIVLAKSLKNKMTTINIIKIKKLTSFILIIFGLILMFQGWFPSKNNFTEKIIEKTIK